jgi:hypothetical protein
MMKMRLSRLVCLLFATLALALPSLAKPELKALAAPDDLKSLYRAGENYTLHLEYKDPDGYEIKSAKFHDKSKDGEPSFDAKDDYKNAKVETGVTLSWEVNGFAKGDHAGYFEIENEKGIKTRYPGKDGTYYSFAVESLVDKWIVMGVGLLICLFMLPFLVYLIARSANKQGNPSSAARIGLIIGIFAALALFIFQFLSWYSPLVLVLGGVAAIFLLVVVITRR